jgi:membrane-associated protease RseP (regulator of RpoE activity)
VAWVIAVGGIIMLIVLHEAGHFFAAKAVGMRVERFSLFFPPTIARFRRGETEYALGAIPAGGYVKITGMSPEELADLDPELAKRAYYAQKPWKRIVVILAGPGMNLLIAFVIFAAVLYSGSLGEHDRQSRTPGHHARRRNDRGRAGQRRAGVRQAPAQRPHRRRRWTQGNRQCGHQHDRPRRLPGDCGAGLPRGKARGLRCQTRRH